MEKKIKNINKSIMIIVAVLLTLVLISTSTVSGIFAKYVVTKSATTEVSLKKFGVKLTMLEGEDFGDSGATTGDNIDPNNNTISATISNIQLIPGSDFPEIIKFVVTDADRAKDFTVNTRIKVKAVVNTTGTTEQAKFTSDEIFFIPIATKIKINGADAKVIADESPNYVDFSSYQTELNNKLQNSNFIGPITGESEWAGATIATAGSANFDQGAITEIAFGFACPETYGTSETDIAKFDKIMTQIAENEAKLSITFYVSLEQIV